MCGRREEGWVWEEGGWGKREGEVEGVREKREEG